MSNYKKKIQALIEQGLVRQEDQNVATVLHDPWCANLNKTGECNCDPDILLCTVLLSPDSDWRNELYPLPKNKS